MARPRIPIGEHVTRHGDQLRRNVSAPDEWWQRVEDYAESNGLTLAAALRQLVDRALAGAA